MATSKKTFYVPDGITFGDNTSQYSAYANSNVANYLPTYSGNLDSLGGNVITTANITGSYILGNGAYLTGIDLIYSNSNVIALLGSGNALDISITGNILANNANVGNNLSVSGDTSLVGNIAVDGWANIDGEANVSSNLIVAGNANIGNVSSTGNIEGNNLVITSGGNLWIGGTPFVRTLTVGRPGRALPVTVPLSSNNLLEIPLAHGGNAVVITT